MTAMTNENAMTNEDFDKLTPREHIRLRPGMYIGNIRSEEVEEWVYDISTKQLIKKINSIPDAMKRCFHEIVGNAADNVTRSRERGFNPKNIEINMTNSTITVTNYGNPIPVVLDKTKTKLVPELIFSDFMSGSNYKKDQTRNLVGLNGMGVKIVFVVSTEAVVHIWDHINKKEFYQVHTNGLAESSKPIVNHYSGKESKIKITYTLDFEYFGMKEYDPLAFDLFARYAMDYSLSSHVETLFNDLTFNVKSTKEMAELYFSPETIETSISFKGHVDIKNSKHKGNPNDINMEITIIDCPFEGNVIAFVNSLMVPSGVHVDAIYKEISDIILPELNMEINGRSVLTTKDIRQHISLVVNCTLSNPEFPSQNKNQLTHPTPIICIPPAILAPIKTWKLMERLKNIIEQKAKQFW